VSNKKFSPLPGSAEFKFQPSLPIMPNNTIQDIYERLGRLEEAYSEITRLQKALAKSESARKALEAQVAALTTAPPLPQARIVTTNVSYASIAAKNTTTPKPKKKGKVKLPSPRAAAATMARISSPQSDNPPGYSFVYYTTKTRRPIKDLRKMLRSLGLNNSRVLDIQYPTSRITSFLVHNDYILDFTTALNQHGHGSSPSLEFDPYDPANLMDPKFASLSRDLRVQKAREVENLRCRRSASFVRRSVRVSVARSFLEKERINQTQFDAILAEELAARAAPTTPSPAPRLSADERNLAKKKRLRYLGYLLHHDKETASLLANAPSPVSSPVLSAIVDEIDDAMKE
jgi:hypothetical protein